MARIVRRSKKGEPAFRGFTQLPGRESTIPIDRKQRIRTLIKRDESKGRTMPEFDRLTDKKGVDTGSGFAASPRTVRSTKRDPQPTGAGKRSIRKARLGPIKFRKSGT